MQADFIYTPLNNGSDSPRGMRLGVSIFASHPDAADQLRNEVLAAGMAVREAAFLTDLLKVEPTSLGDIVLVDCPKVDAVSLAALSRLDLQAKQSGAQLIVSTSVPALDDVFACCDQSCVQILVDPNCADRVVALGRALAQFSDARLRELSDDDRLTLLRLTEQVSEIALRIGGNTAGQAIFGDGGAFSFESPAPGFNGKPAPSTERLVRPSLPDPRLVRRIIRQRQQRGTHFGTTLFADPAWDMLLDLTAARAEEVRVSVTSLCIASGVPPTTALRWIGQMTEGGLLKRVEDDCDRRRAFITLTDSAARRMARYFAELGTDAALLV